MSIRRVTCPGCRTAANVPAGMATVRCPKCGHVWNANDPKASEEAVTTRPAGTDADSNERGEAVSTLMVIGFVGGGLLLFSLVGLAVYLVQGLGNKQAGDAGSGVATADAEETIKPATPEPYRVVSLPESTRRQIYADYRKVARTTVEEPLPVPQGTAPRQAVEGMLQGVFDRELTRFAALHDISVDDVKEIIKEGDAKQWDKSPRSNAVRDGKRVYPREQSEGWDKDQQVR